MQTALAPPPPRRTSPAARKGRRDPRAEADFARGLALSQSDRWGPAAEAFASATQRRPDDPVFWLNLAHARVKLGELELATEAARRAVLLDPRSQLGIAIAAQCLAAANRHEEVIELVRGLGPDHADDPTPHFQLGEAYRHLHRLPEAIQAYLAALSRRPQFFQAHVQLGTAFEGLKMYEEARECFQTALALGGNRAELLAAMAYRSQHACRWDLYAQDLAHLQHELQSGTSQPGPFQLLTTPSSRGQQLAAARAHWIERCGAIERLPKAGARGARSRIRIGYATSDVFRHATAYLIAEVLERHDRARFDVFVYSYGHDDGSAIRQRIIAAADGRFVDARAISDRVLAERVRSDDIDILIDLKGYTFGSRIGAFALHPARIQVNFLGYPGTLGSPAYEYIIGDRIVTPIEHASDFAEKIAQLPHCYQPNDRRRPIGPAPRRADCGLPEQGFVFCSFNSCYKITAAVFDRWCRLLHQVEGSVLWLYEANPQARRNLHVEAQRRGIAAERLVWAPHVDLAAHLGRLQLADLALDTLPVNAHTTASDALWAGVPMVTTAGQSFVSRVASSVLHAADLPQLVAGDADGYELLALELARDPARLRELRHRLAANRDRCALFDSRSYTRDLEALLTRMMAGWERGAPPEHLAALA
jgi:predicted O-linked N-acetylglucosamine transferase (SPINDLY family)